MENDDKRMTFTEHLGELRTRIIRSIAALLLAVVVCYALSDMILKQLARPLAPLDEHGLIAPPEKAPDGAATAPGAETAPDTPATAEAKTPRSMEWTVLNPLEFVVVKLKIAGYGGFLLALPFVLYQLMAFVFPGLLPNERRMVQILVGGCSVLGLAGVGIAYFGVFPLVLPYLLEWTPAWVQIQLRVNETISIIVKLLAGFAVAFQFPMVVLVLVYMGLLTPQALRDYRKFAIVIMALAAAILTPPDVVSMGIMLLPLVILYEMSIWTSYLVLRRKKKNEDAAAAETP